MPAGISSVASLAEAVRSAVRTTVFPSSALLICSCSRDQVLSPQTASAVKWAFGAKDEPAG